MVLPDKDQNWRPVQEAVFEKIRDVFRIQEDEEEEQKASKIKTYEQVKATFKRITEIIRQNLPKDDQSEIFGQLRDFKSQQYFNEFNQEIGQLFTQIYAKENEVKSKIEHTEEAVKLKALLSYLKKGKLQFATGFSKINVDIPDLVLTQINAAMA